MASIMVSSAHSTAHHPATGVPHQLGHPEELHLCQRLYARTTSLLCDLVKDLGQSLLVLVVLICDIKRSIPCIRLPSCWQGAGGSSAGPGQERKPPLLAPTWAPSRSTQHSANKDRSRDGSRLGVLCGEAKSAPSSKGTEILLFHPLPCGFSFRAQKLLE